MATTVSTIQEGSALEVAVHGTLRKSDYDAFLPIVEKAIKAQGKVRILFDMHDFHGWDTAALWADLKFDAKHFDHFERIAMVGEKKWQRAMAAFCKPFTTGKVKYFERSEKEAAKLWLLS